MVRPSATRYGQRVDNPPLETSDTAKLRALVQTETQDEFYQQGEINKEVLIKIENHWGYIRSHDEKLAKVAYAGQVASLWKILAALVPALLTVLGWMFHEIERLKLIVAVCCSGSGGAH